MTTAKPTKPTRTTVPLAARDALAELSRLRALIGETVARYEASLAPTPAPAAPPTHIRSPRDVVTLLAPEMVGLEQEQLRVLVLNTKNRVLDTVLLYQGTLLSSTVRIAELFRAAIRLNAACVLLVHNHPSGDATHRARRMCG